MRSSFLVFGSPRIEEDEIAEVVDSLRSAWLGTGPKVARFEAMFREYVGSRYAVAVHSCTAEWRRDFKVHIEGEILNRGYYPTRSDSSKLSELFARAGGLKETAYLAASHIIRNSKP